MSSSNPEPTSFQSGQSDLNNLLSSAIQNTRKMSESLTDLTSSTPASPLLINRRTRNLSEVLGESDGGPSSTPTPPRRKVSRNLSRASSTMSLTSTREDDELGSAATTPLMGRSVRNISRSSSTLSLTAGQPGMAPIESLTKHVRERLCGKLFSGWYTERRYMDAIERYKDVIVIDGVEADTIKQIKYAIRKSKKILADNCYIGLALDDDECRVYVSLGMGVSQLTHAFGHYWFHVRHVSFLPSSGFVIDLAIVRPFVESDTKNCFGCRQRSREVTPPVQMDSIGSAVSDMKSRLQNILNQVLAEYCQPKQAWENMKPHLTRGNVMKGVRFVCVLVLTLVTGCVALLQQMAGFSLRALHELAFLVDRSTPFALGAMNFASKIVGGFYLLVAMIWKDFRAPKQQQKKVGPALAVGGGPVPRAALPAPPPGPGPAASRPAQHAAMDNMYSSAKRW